MLNFTRQGTLSEYLELSINNISSIEYIPTTDEFLVLSNSPGGVGAVYNNDLTAKVRDFSISINNADSEDVTFVSGTRLAYCSEGNTVEEFDYVTGARYGKYILPPWSVRNRGFECLAYDQVNQVYYAAQEGYPMILYRFQKSPADVKATYDLTAGGYEIPFDLENVLSSHTDHVAGLTFHGQNLMFICEYNGSGKIIEVTTDGQVVDTFTDLPIFGDNNGGYEAITKGPGGDIFVGSEPRHWLRLIDNDRGQDVTRGLVSGEIMQKGEQIFRGQRYLTVAYRFVDHLGSVHITPSRHFHETYDIAADYERRRSRIESHLINVEIQNALSVLSNGGDPLSSAVYQSNDDLIAGVLREILKMNPAEASKYNMSSRVALMSDSRILELLGNDIVLSDVRQWRSDVDLISPIVNKGPVIND